MGMEGDTRRESSVKVPGATAAGVRKTCPKTASCNPKRRTKGVTFEGGSKTRLNNDSSVYTQTSISMIPQGVLVDRTSCVLPPRRQKGLIHSIYSDQNSSKHLRGSELVSSLEKSIRKTVDVGRADYDRLHFKLKEKKRELEAVKLTLQDLQKEGTALGLEMYTDDNERLQANKSVSRRPIFLASSNVHEREQAVKHKLLEIEQEYDTLRVRNFMRKRAMREAEDANEMKLAVARSLESEKRQVGILERELVTARFELGRAITNHEEEARDCEREQIMWKNELNDRRRFIELTKSFEKFMQDTKDETHKIELKAHGELDHEGEKKLLKKGQTTRALQLGSKFARNLLATDADNQDMVFHQAFQTLGLKLGNFQEKGFTVKLDPNEVIKKCVQQNEIRINLEDKKANLEENISRLQKLVEEGTQNVLSQSLYGRDIKTNRMLEEAELALFAKRKEAEKQRDKIRFLQKVLHPVQTGIQIIGKKLCHNDGHTLSTKEFGSLIQARVKELVEHEGDFGQHKAIPKSPAHSPTIAAKAALDNAELFVSPNNLRVKARNWSLDSDKDLDDEQKKGQVRRSRGMSISSRVEEDEKRTGIRGRGDVKKDSTCFIRTSMRSQKSFKRKKKGVVFNRLYGSKN